MPKSISLRGSPRKPSPKSMKRNKSSNYLDAVFQEGEESINHVRQLITRQTFELNVHRRKPVNLDYEGVNAKDASVVDISYVLGYPLVEHGLMALDKHVDRMNRFLNTTEGRDKFTKVVQNIARVLSFVAGLRSHAWKDISERLNHLDRASSTCRKFLKLGTAFTFVRLFFRVASVEKNIINKLLACGRFFWLALYFTFDNVVWAGRMRIIDIEQRPFSVYALKSYLMSIFCQLILDCQQLYKTIKKIESLRLQENRKDCPFSEGKKLTQLTKNEDLPELFAKVSPVVELQLLKAKKKQLLISFFKNGLDITCAIEGTWGIGLNRGHIGVMNIVSALIAGYRIYKRCEMEQEDELKEKRRAEVLKQTSRKLSSTGNAHTKQKSKTKKKKAANKKRSSERGGSEQKLQ